MPLVTQSHGWVVHLPRQRRALGMRTRREDRCCRSLLPPATCRAGAGADPCGRAQGMVSGTVRLDLVPLEKTQQRIVVHSSISSGFSNAARHRTRTRVRSNTWHRMPSVPSSRRASMVESRQPSTPNRRIAIHRRQRTSFPSNALPSSSSTISLDLSADRSAGLSGGAPFPASASAALAAAAGTAPGNASLVTSAARSNILDTLEISFAMQRVQNLAPCKRYRTWHCFQYAVPCRHGDATTEQWLHKQETHLWRC